MNGHLEFYIPHETDVESLQRTVCNAASNGETSFCLLLAFSSRIWRFLYLKIPSWLLSRKLSQNRHVQSLCSLRQRVVESRLSSVPQCNASCHSRSYNTLGTCAYKSMQHSIGHYSQQHHYFYHSCAASSSAADVTTLLRRIATHFKVDNIGATGEMLTQKVREVLSSTEAGTLIIDDIEKVGKRVMLRQ